MVKARWHLLVSLFVASTLFAQAAVATHMSNYRYNPVEHDDQGRSLEPDFASTGVLGTLVANCVVDLTPADAGCVADTALPAPGAQAAVLAPGCTDDSGRQPSGLCGLYTVGAGNGNTAEIVPPGVAGVRGMSGAAAPGRLTPTKGSVVRFLDAQLQAAAVPPAGGAHYYDVNLKMRDSGAAALLRSVDASFGGDVIAPGGNALWAWYGVWQDKNGNGVIDHMEGDAPAYVDPATNEFVWYGNCIQFNGQPAPAGQRYCVVDSGMKMPVWIFPGNHHAFCGFGLNIPTIGALPCGTVPGDAPGRAVFWLAVDDPANLEEDDALIYADPIFGEQNSQYLDQDSSFGGVDGMGDRTGEPLITGRHWVYGLGWATWFYDQSLAVSTVQVTGVTKDAKIQNHRNGYDLTKLTSADVDAYRSWTPVLESLLQGTVKPAARGTYLFGREFFSSGANATDVWDGTRLTYDECDPNLGVCLGTGSAQTSGRLGDRVFDPGWAKEPNTAGDVYPAASRGGCADAFATHQGMCNGYAGHKLGWNAWMEVQSFAGYYGNLAWRPPIGNCISCVTGGPSGLPGLGAGYVRAEGEYTRVLQPGSHIFSGIVGAWRDKAQVHTEKTLDILASVAALQPVFREETYVVPADGWIGDVVNTTGTPRSVGFQPEACTIYGVTGTYEYGQCHPYLDGNRGDSNSYADAAPSDEWEHGSPNAGSGSGGTCNGRPALLQWCLKVTPVDGCWNVPVLVWRQFDTWTIGDTGAIQDFTGRCNADAVIELSMGDSPGLITRDLVILPQGNMGEAVQSEVSGTVTAKDLGRGIDVTQFVRDVDVYGPYGG